MLRSSKIRELQKIAFEHRIRHAYCVGNRGEFYDRWARRRDDRVCENGHAIRCVPGDYILVQWVGLSDSLGTLYCLDGDGDLEVVEQTIDDVSDAIRDAVLTHGNPAALKRIVDREARESAAKVERKKHGRAHRRAALDTLAATLETGEYFRTPTGYLGYLAGKTKSLVTWYAIDSVPAGTEVVKLPAEPHEEMSTLIAYD